MAAAMLTGKHGRWSHEEQGRGKQADQSKFLQHNNLPLSGPL
jgi:hypothetical protein